MAGLDGLIHLTGPYHVVLVLLCDSLSLPRAAHVGRAVPGSMGNSPVATALRTLTLAVVHNLPDAMTL